MNERNKINIWLRSCYTNLAVKTPFSCKKFAIWGYLGVILTNSFLATLTVLSPQTNLS